MSAVRTTSRLALGLLAGVLLLALGAPAVGAQGLEDPYGSTSTTAPPEEVEPTCTLIPDQGQPGDTITARVTGVFFGETVSILFDGVIVATQKAPDALGQSAGAPVAFNGAALPAQALTTTLLIDFTIPRDAAPGNHIITATGDTFTCFCNPNGIFKVLGATGGGGKPGGGGSLARTGIYAGLLLAIALVLLLAGRALMQASKRRRRQATMAFHLEDDRTMVGPPRS